MRLVALEKELNEKSNSAMAFLFGEMVVCGTTPP